MQNHITHPPIPTSLLAPPLIDARQGCEHFRGRTIELNALLAKANNLPAPLFAVAGAPGAGKTSLLAEFRKRLPKHICRVSLEPEHFRTDQQLMRQIHQFLPRLDQFKRIIPDIVAHLMDTGATTVAKAGGVELQIKAFSELLELRNLQTNDATEPLRLLSAAFPGGYVITLDEAQSLGKLEDSSLAHTFLHALHENPNNEYRPFGKGWLLLAGLSNIGQVLDKFWRYRISRTYFLSALDDEDARAVLMDHVAELMPSLNSQDRKRVAQEWVPKLSAGYRHWPHHLQGAATSLAHVVAHGYISDEGLQTIRFYADEHIRELYQSIRYRLTTAGFNKLSVHFAFLATRNHGVITVEMAEALVRRVKGIEDEERVLRILMKLQEIGFLEYGDLISAIGVDFPHYRVPIPSLLSWIVKNRMLDGDDLAVADDIQRQYGGEIKAIFAKHACSQ